jgi:hypothetical protein
MENEKRIAEVYKNDADCPACETVIDMLKTFGFNVLVFDFDRAKETDPSLLEQSTKQDEAPIIRIENTFIKPLDVFKNKFPEVAE